MIPAALLLLGIGLADVCRQLCGARSRGARAVLSVLAVVVVSAVGVGLAPWPLVALTAALALVWLLLMPSTSAAPLTGFWPAIGVGIAVVAFLLFAPAAGQGWAVDAWTGVGMTAPLERVLLVLGVCAFLLDSANVAVRAALHSEGVAEAHTDEAAGAASVRRPRLRAMFGRLRAPVSPEPGVPAKQLRGGRLIGPLERLLIVGLMFANALPLLAGFVAAKGIVRFPEIQRDNADGTQAEYFLVGSMTSWAIALAAAGILWVVDATPAGLGIS